MEGGVTIDDPLVGHGESIWSVAMNKDYDLIGGGGRWHSAAADDE